ncbi:MAG: class I SAM-dependent methyltransferase [Chloroflexota bacterium]
MTDDGFFGAEVAARYDDDLGEHGRPDVIEATVDLVAGLAGEGRALEFAVGTGRLAIPLAQRGVPVHGIDRSRAMIERLRAKPGGELVHVEVGDMTSTRVPGSFSMVYLVFNTIMNLVTQDAQVACFQNAAAHLGPGGVFLIETMVPDLRHLPPGQTLVPFRSDATGFGIDEYDTLTQGLVSHHIDLADGVPRYSSGPFRYVWPSELDLMARIAGLRLRDRWADWARSPFTAESRSHVSVWERPTDR